MTRYPGSELEVFRLARNWKAYWGSVARPYVRGAAADVGAGLGENVPLLQHASVSSWTCIEPDPELAARIRERAAVGELPSGVEVVAGTLADLPAGRSFDTLLYADVIEHIADDRAELEAAAARLRPGGHLVVLVPAHGFLFSPFDTAIGHHRRYDRGRLRAIAPPDLRSVLLRYLDSVGMLASLGNRILTRRSLPSASQIRLWDGRLVPVSRRLDPLLGWRVGKSLLAVWRRPH